MKNVLALILILPILNGCMSPPTSLQQQRTFDGRPYKASTGKTWTVSELKGDYTRKTGAILTAPDSLKCGWDGSCYYDVWANAHDNGIAEFQANAARQKKAADAKCEADQECKKNKQLNSEMKNLSWSYTVLLSTNQYSQSEYDYAVRSVCESATSAQKNGVSQQKVLDSLRDLPGLGFQEREYFLSAAKACWNISNLKGNWKLALRSQY